MTRTSRGFGLGLAAAALAAVALCGSAATASAAEGNFQLISGDGGSIKIIDAASANGSDLGEFLDKIYIAGVGAVAVLAVVMIVWGAIQIMSENVFGHDLGKHKIWNAVWGLLLALGSFVILQTISTSLTTPKFTSSGASSDALQGGVDTGSGIGNVPTQSAPTQSSCPNGVCA